MFADSLKGGGLGEVIQANKVPLTLIGIGIAWLVASNTGLADRVANDERVQAARRRIGEFAGDIGIGGGSSDGAGGKANGAGDRRQQRALARAVCTDDSRQTARDEFPGDRLQRCPPTVTHGHIAQPDMAVSQRDAVRAMRCLPDPPHPETLTRFSAALKERQNQGSRASPSASY